MGTSFKRSHTFPATLSAPTLQQATMTRLSAGDSWTCPGKTSQFLVDSLLLSHGSWCTQCSVYALQKSIPQSCVSSGSSMMGLMSTSSKRAYAKPKSAASRTPAPVAVHCWPVPPQEMLKHSSFSVSVGSLGPGVHKVCLSPLSTSGNESERGERKSWLKAQHSQRLWHLVPTLHGK